MSQLIPIQIRRDTAANWTAANIVLLSGEFGIETDTGHVKIGDGVTAWNAITAYLVNSTLLAAALLGKVSNAIAWLPASNTNPTLASGTALSGAYAGVNTVVNQTAGTTTLTTPIDGITTTVFGDVWVFGFGGTSTWSIMRAGGGYLGSFASAAALQAANPAATYPGAVALAAAVLYISNGVSWGANVVLDGTGHIAAAQLPAPTATTLGGVQSAAPVAHQFLTGISTAGVPTTAQPAAADVAGLAPSATTDTTNAGNITSGTLSVARLPAAVLGANEWQGTYNAATNTPAIVAGNKGFFWTVTTAGTSLGFNWLVGDKVFDDGAAIERMNGNNGEVITVGGQSPNAGGNVSLALANLSDGAAQQAAITGAASAASTAQSLASAAIPSSQKGAANGVAALDASSHVSAAQLPVILTTRGTVTGIGDSIMGYGDAVIAGNSGGGTTEFGATSQSIVAWASAFLTGARFSMVTNRGVPGTLIDGTLTGSILSSNSPTFPAAMTDRSDILWIHTGINHLNPTIDTTTPTNAQIIQKFTQLLNLASPQKSVVIVDALTPLNASASSPTGAAARRTDIPLINALLKTLCAQYTNVLFNDVYTALALDTSGNADPTCVLATDGIHLTTKGAYLAGLATVANLSGRLNLLAGYRATKTLLLPQFTGSGGTTTPGSGTISGTVPAGFNLIIASGTAAVTASVANNTLTLVIDNTAGGAASAVQLSFASFTAYLGTLASGDTIIGGARLVVRSPSGLKRNNVTFQLNPSATTNNFEALAKSNIENTSLTPTFPSVSYPSAIELTTPPLTLGATPASVNLATTLELAAGGYVSVDISNYFFSAVTPF